MFVQIGESRRAALLLQLDGTLPNVALMRLAAHLRACNYDIHFQRVRSFASLQNSLFFQWDEIYASAIFDRTRPLVDELKRLYPAAVVGGTGSGSTIASKRSE
jgi:hypothetical protein